MRKIERQAILIEFERYIYEKYKVAQEAVFKDFMKTKRRFRADYVLPTEKIIIEINGGQWISGRHNRGGKGYENDLTKLNLAQKNDYKVYQFTYEMLLRQDYLNYL